MKGIFIVIFSWSSFFVVLFAGTVEEQPQKTREKATSFGNYYEFNKACRSFMSNKKEFESLLQEYAKKGEKVDESTMLRLETLQKRYDEFGEACLYKVNQD